MAKYITTPETISGKVKVRLPTQAQALSSRYVFLNLQNAEPNLGTPTFAGSACPDPDGVRYFLLSNNSYSTSLTASSAWRVWSYDTPRVAAYAEMSSLALGNGQPVNNNSLVFSNYTYQNNNRYNSQTLEEETFNVYSVSGIYLFDPTTIGDPVSATSFIVLDNGYVGVNTDTPNERFTVNGSISARNNITAVQNLTIRGNSNLGDAKTDYTAVRGELRVGDSTTNPMVFGEAGSSFDVNLYRAETDILKTDDTFHSYALSSMYGLTGADVTFTNAYTAIPTSTTDTGAFLILNINGSSKAIRLWDYTV